MKGQIWKKNKNMKVFSTNENQSMDFIQNSK